MYQMHQRLKEDPAKAVNDEIRKDRGLTNILCIAYVSMEERGGLNDRHPTILKCRVGCTVF